VTTTLLITTLNRGPLLRKSLSRLCDLTLPDEVLVIDDGGTDDTAAVCAEYESRLPMRYVYHDNPGQKICSQARNVGVKLAAGDLILTSEPELVFLTDVVSQFHARLAQQPNDVVSAGTIYFAKNSEGTWEQAKSDAFVQEVGWVATYAALYNKDWLLDIGGWDEQFPGVWGWDDTDLVTRLRLAGHGQQIATEVEVAHQWHPLGADPDSVNEMYFFTKSFHTNPSDGSHVVANQGASWGQLRTRTS
jgi:glycosyltransferase involved in cell wall biosynthesis